MVCIWSKISVYFDFSIPNVTERAESRASELLMIQQQLDSVTGTGIATRMVQ